MRSSITSVLMLATSFLFGCSPSNDCLVSDSLDRLSSFKVKGGEQTIYLRTTGFSEKENFYELFSEHPKFDGCGVANISPLSQIHIDSTAGKPIKLIVTSNSLTLQYSEGEVSVDVLKNIEIEVK